MHQTYILIAKIPEAKIFIYIPFIVQQIMRSSMVYDILTWMLSFQGSIIFRSTMYIVFTLFDLCVGTHKHL